MTDTLLKTAKSLPETPGGFFIHLDKDDGIEIQCTKCYNILLTVAALVAALVQGEHCCAAF